MGSQTNATAAAPAVSIDDVLAAMKAVDLGPEPIGEWMRSLGFDPADGCALVLPSSMAHLAGAFPPKYVLVSTLALDPMLLRGAFLPEPDDRRLIDSAAMVLRDQYGWNFSIATD